MYYRMTIESFSYTERILWLSYSMETRLWLRLLHNYIITRFQSKLFLYKLITGNSSYALSVHNKIMLLLPKGEVVVSAGDEEAITCTDIGELLSSCHQYCVTWWSPIIRFRSCWRCASVSASTTAEENSSTTAEENWLVHWNNVSYVHVQQGLWLVCCYLLYHLKISDGLQCCHITCTLHRLGLGYGRV